MDTVNNTMSSLLSEAKNVDIALGLTALFVLGSAMKWALQSRDSHFTKEIPGPPGLPILRNILDAPRKDEWIVFNEWRKQYGMFCHSPSCYRLPAELTFLGHILKVQS
jgi:hypothetical protein